MDEVQIENWVYKQSLKQIMNLDRVKNLIKAEKASEYDIEKIVSDAVKCARKGAVTGRRMRAADVFDIAESAVRQRYKGVKLSWKKTV